MLKMSVYFNIGIMVEDCSDLKNNVLKEIMRNEMSNDTSSITRKYPAAGRLERFH